MKLGLAWSVILAGTAILVGAPQEAQAYCQQTTSGQQPSDMSCPSSGEPLAWTRPCLSYAIHEDGSEDLQLTEVYAAVEDSFQTWVDVTCDGGVSPGFQVVANPEPAICDSTEYNTGRGNANIIVFVSEWDERSTPARTYSPAALALTTVWHNVNTGEIFDADIEINQENHTFGNCSLPTGCPAADFHDLRNMLTHEIGHFFGLAHTQVETATMHGNADEGEVLKRTLADDDTAGFCAIYAPSDALSDSCSFTPRGGLSYICGGTDVGGGCNSNPGLAETVPAWLMLPTTLLGCLALRRRRT